MKLDKYRWDMNEARCGSRIPKKTLVRIHPCGISGNLIFSYTERIFKSEHLFGSLLKYLKFFKIQSMSTVWGFELYQGPLIETTIINCYHIHLYGCNPFRIFNLLFFDFYFLYLSNAVRFLVIKLWVS